MKRLALFAAFVVAVPFVADAQTVTGTWTTELWTSEGVEQVQLQMQIDRNRGRWNMGTSIDADDLSGVSREQLAGSVSDVRFELAREAGTVAFEGDVRSGRGSGHFTFTVAPAYVQRMATLGFGGLDDEELFTLAVQDVTTAYVQELRELGYDDLDTEDLLAFAIHGVSTEFIRAMNALGYADIDADELVTMRIHGITPEWVRDIRAALAGS